MDSSRYFPRFGSAARKCIVKSVTIERLAEWGVTGTPSASAIRAIRHARVADVRLRNVDRTHLQHSPPNRQVAILFAPRDIQRKRLLHFPSLLEFPVGAGLLEMRHAVDLEEPAHFDRPARREAAIGVHEEGHVLPERLSNGRNHGLGAARPDIGIRAALLPDAELESVESQVVPKPPEPLALRRRADIPPHGGSVCSERPG